jgi:hypothetical protein
MRVSLPFLSGLIWLWSAADVCSQQPVQLKWNLNAGNDFTMEMHTKTHQDMKVMGQALKQSQDQKFFLSFSPRGPKGQGWSVVQRFDRFVMEIDIGGNKIAVDTAKPQAAQDPNGLATLFTSLVGVELDLTLDKNFKVIQVRGADRVEAKVAAANPDTAKLMKQILTEQAFRQMNSFFQVASPEPVKKGDRWNDEITSDMGPLGKMKLLNRFVYDGQEGTLQAITASPNASFDAAAAKPAGALPFTLKGGKLSTTASAGKYLFDNQKGLLRSAEVEMTLSGKLVIDTGGMETEIELTQTQKTVLRGNVK